MEGHRVRADRGRTGSRTDGPRGLLGQGRTDRSSASARHFGRVGPDALDGPLGLRRPWGADALPPLDAGTGPAAADLDHPGGTAVRSDRLRPVRAEVQGPG